MNDREWTRFARAIGLCGAEMAPATRANLGDAILAHDRIAQAYHRFDVVAGRAPPGPTAPIFHAGPTGPHDCRPRIWADCAACGARRVLCGVGRATIAAIMRRRWTCGGCQEGETGT